MLAAIVYISCAFFLKKDKVRRDIVSFFNLSNSFFFVTDYSDRYGPSDLYHGVRITEFNLRRIKKRV